MAGPFDGELIQARQRGSAVDSVIATIRDLLITKQLKRGDRLPNEIELTQKLNTSRGTIREAMKILSAFGIIEIKRGRGTFMSHSTSNRLFDHLVFQMILSDTDKKKLAELRELIEIGIIKIVIANATDEDIALIRQECDRMAESMRTLDAGPEAMTDLDVRFHLAVAKATRNELIRKVYEFTLDLFTPSIQETHRRPNNSRIALAHHQKILAGIEARDRARAEAAVEESLEQWVLRSS